MSKQFLEDVEIIDVDSLPPDDDGFYPCEEGENLEPLTGVFGFGTTSSHVLASWLPAAYRKWGVKFVIASGAATRGRPISAGYFDPNAALVHHTGTTSSAERPNPSLRTLIEGRSDLKGPLCQTTLGYDGVTTIIAYGRANHAGAARAAMGNPAGDGNAMYLGKEVATSGTQKMPAAQYDALVLSLAAELDHWGYTDARKLGLHHTTSTSGKWDLGAGTGVFGVPYSLTKLRADVTARLKAGPPNAAPRTTLRPGDRGDDVTALQQLLNAAGASLTIDGSYGPATEAAVRTFQTSAGLTVDGIAGPLTRAALTTSPEEDDMALTDKVTVRDMGQTKTREVTVETVLARASWAYFETLNLKAGVADIQAKLATLAAAGDGGLDPARAEAIYREEMAKRLAKLDFVDEGGDPQ